VRPERSAVGAAAGRPPRRERRRRRAAARARRDWEDWGAIDPLWAIVTDPERAKGGWELGELLASGEQTVAAIFEVAGRLGYPKQRRVALDFGCGIGRLSRALCRRVEVVYGLDAAATMIERAMEVNRDCPACRFSLHRDADLRSFADGSVDLVLCLLVLQHLPERRAIDTYLAEFVRILSPGGLAVVQLPTVVPTSQAPASLRGRLRVRTRLTQLLRDLGMSPRLLYDRLGWMPSMPMSAVPTSEVVAVVESAGGEVLEITDPVAQIGGVVSRDYYLTRRRAPGP
jgi:SAM-dependent methyltransferase